MVPESIYLATDKNLSSYEQGVLDRAVHMSVPIFSLGPGVVDRVSDAQSPQGVLSVFSQLDVGLEKIVAPTNLNTNEGDQLLLGPTNSNQPGVADSDQGARLGGPLVVCVGVRDPGNAGTIMRSAAGFGSPGVIFCEGCVDPYNPKTLRSSAGAIFQVPISVDRSVGQVIDLLGDRGYVKVGTSSHCSRSVFDVDLTGRVAVFVGNEARGIESDMAGKFDYTIGVPLDRDLESLNVAVACSVILAEAMRQRLVAVRPTFTPQVSL